MDNGTTFEDNYVDLSDENFILPDFAVSTLPFFKDKNAHETFLKKAISKTFESEEEMKEMAEKAFFSKPQDLIEKVWFGADYMSAFNVDLDLEKGTFINHLVQVFYIATFIFTSFWN